MPGRSSGPRRQWKVETAISRRCSTTIAACPCDAIRCGRCCTISMVGPRTGRHRRRGFSGGRFPICSRVCCHRSTCCPCQGNVVRPSRQVLEEAGCPALNGCPLIVSRQAVNRDEALLHTPHGKQPCSRNRSRQIGPLTMGFYSYLRTTQSHQG